MKQIRLGKPEKQLFMTIDDRDFELLNKYRWYRDSYGYAVATLPVSEQVKGKSKRIKAHRLIMGSPVSKSIDHINHNLLDNRRSNLRVVTQQQNLLNKLKTRGSSVYKGVSWFERDKNWLAKITLNYKQIYLGYFDNELEAAQAYDLKAKELFKEYARPNFT